MDQNETSTTASGLTAVALVCSLKPSPARSSSELLAHVKPGVELDMGDGDA